MHQPQAPKLSQFALHQPEDRNAIHELQTQLLQERFIEKLAKFAERPTNSQTSTNQSQGSEAHSYRWKNLQRKGIATLGIGLAMSSIAASPLGHQIDLNPLSDWVSRTTSSHIQNAVLSQVEIASTESSPEQAESSHHNAIATPSAELVSESKNIQHPTIFMDTLEVDNTAIATLLPDASPSQKRTFFMDTLRVDDAPAHPNSGLVMSGLPLEQQAFLMTIAQAEGATYTTIYGGSQFSDFSKHPHQCIPINLSGYEGMCSDAAGKYQFLSSTWALLGLSDFSPINQDLGAVMLIQETNAFNLLEQGNVAGAFCAVGPIWASLPCNSYHQNPKSLTALIAMYEHNLQLITEAH